MIARTAHSLFGIRHGFTLIELLAVIAVIAILAGLLLPALSGARHSADSAVCKSNLHQLDLGLTLYGEDHQLYPGGSSPTPEFPFAVGWWHQLEAYVSS